MYSSICIDGHHCTDFALSYGNVQEVLAPVPSYDKWQELNKDIYTITELWKQERSQLKELEQKLKELEKK